MITPTQGRSVRMVPVEMRQDLLLDDAWAEGNECAEGAVVRDEGEAGVVELHDERLESLAAKQVDGGGPAVQGVAQNVGCHRDVLNFRLVVEILASNCVVVDTPPMVAVLMAQLHGSTAIGLQA